MESLIHTLHYRDTVLLFSSALSPYKVVLGLLTVPWAFSTYIQILNNEILWTIILSNGGFM